MGPWLAPGPLLVIPVPEPSFYICLNVQSLDHNFADGSMPSSAIGLMSQLRAFQTYCAPFQKGKDGFGRGPADLASILLDLTAANFKFCMVCGVPSSSVHTMCDHVILPIESESFS